MVSRTIMTESERGSQFWIKSAVAGCDAQNTTYKERVGTTPWRLMHSEKRDVSLFRAIGCRTWFISTQKEEMRASICELLRQSILDSNPKQVRINFSFRKTSCLNSYHSDQTWMKGRQLHFLKQKVLLCARWDQLPAGGGQASSQLTFSPLTRGQKQDCWQQSQRNMDGRYWRPKTRQAFQWEKM